MLEALLPYHETLLDTMQARVGALARGGGALAAGWRPPELAALDALGFEEGAGTAASLATGAWEAARASGALTRIGIDALFLLSAAYTTQSHVDRALQRLAERHDRYTLALIEGERSASALVGFASGLSAVVRRERNLCATYRTLARRLSGAEPDPERRCGSGNVTIQ